MTYQISQTTQVTIVIYNLLSKEVLRLNQGLQKPNQYELGLNTSTWKAGRYISVLMIDGKIGAKQQLLLP